MLATPIVSLASFGGSCGLQRSDIEVHYNGKSQVHMTPPVNRTGSLGRLKRAPVSSAIAAYPVSSEMWSMPHMSTAKKEKPSAGGSILAEGSTPRAPGGS
jgi:hypothetical protein